MSRELVHILKSEWDELTALCAELKAILAAPSRDRTDPLPQSSEATARPCFNCGLDSTGKMTHSFGCPNAPVFREPAQSVRPQGHPKPVGRYLVRGGRVVEWEIDNGADERPDGAYELFARAASPVLGVLE